jgi:RNA polymerase sigma factor (sigma-70 family)
VSELLDLLECHGRYLFRLLHRVTLREDVAEDLLQELFLKLRASRGFGSAGNRLAYARRAALRLAFDWRRLQGRLRTSSLPEDEAAVRQRSPLERLEDREQIEGVLEAMAGLSDRNIELLTMRYIQQDSFETIGAHFGTTPHQVRALCSKALAQLRTLIAQTRPEILERHKP